LADNEKDTFRSKVTERLTDFFGEQDSSETSTNNTNSSGLHDSPLTNLNAILLSIEWEITDEILTGLIAEIERLKDIYQDDKILFSFLQLHGSVGKYINTKKVTAHPESIKLLHSVYHGFEKVVESPEMSEAEKKRLLSDEVEKFKALKEQILRTKKEAARKVEAKPSEEPSPAVGTEDVSTQEPETKIASQDLVFVLEEIKKIIKAEFKDLKAELQSLVDDLHRR